MSMGKVCLLFLLLCTLCIPANAQFSGRLSGAVVDATGAVVPDAQVDLYLTGGSKPLLSARTNGEGAYAFIGVRPAEYDVIVEVPGFSKAALRGIVVDPARETSVRQIKLELSGVTQEVEVQAGPELVPIGNAEISSTITMTQVDRLPVLDRDPAGRCLEWQLDYGDQRSSDVLLQHDVGRHQHSRQLHPR
jgi:hypothetical protein